MAHLGLRYRPANQADLDAHAQLLKLLAEDLADVPASLLERAAQRWAKESRFMPKAAELIALSRTIASDAAKGTRVEQDRLQAHCDELNAASTGLRWRVAGRAPHRFIEPVA